MVEKSIATRMRLLWSCIDIVKSDGNWNVSPYQMGLANGLILANHIIMDSKEEVPYLSKPDVWLEDLKESK